MSKKNSGSSGKYMKDLSNVVITNAGVTLLEIIAPKNGFMLVHCGFNVPNTLADQQCDVKMTLSAGGAGDALIHYTSLDGEPGAGRIDSSMIIHVEAETTYKLHGSNTSDQNILSGACSFVFL